MRAIFLFLAPFLVAAAPATVPPMAITSHAVTAADYPAESIPLQEQGTTRVAYTVGTDGITADLRIAQSSGSVRLDEAALAIVGRWRYAPAKQAGRPVVWHDFANVAFVLN